MDLYLAYLRLFLAFPLVLLLIFLCFRYIIPRFAPALGMGGSVQVVERVVLNARTTLFVVRAGDEYLLLASSANGVTLLKVLEEGYGAKYYGAGLENIWQDNQSFAGFLGKFRSLRTERNKNKS
jgi:flagellar biogenesis protein FliO